MAVSDYLKTEFLDEPIYRWFAFFVVMMAFLIAWNGVVSYMKD